MNLDKAMLRELECSAFHSVSALHLLTLQLKNGRAGFMLKAGAAETRKRATPKQYPLAFMPMKVINTAEAELGDSASEMGDSCTAKAGSQEAPEDKEMIGSRR